MNKFVCDCGETVGYFKVGTCGKCNDRHCLTCHKNLLDKNGKDGRGRLRCCDKCMDQWCDNCVKCVKDSEKLDDLLQHVWILRVEMSRIRKDILALQSNDDSDDDSDDGSDSDSDSELVITRRKKACNCVHEDELPSRITIALKEAYSPGDCVIETDDGEYDVLTNGAIVKRK